MVDLVKIRQKAKKAKLSGAPAPSPARDRLEKFLEEAGKRRDTVAPLAPEPAGDQFEALTFLIGNERYAVDIEPIVSIVMPGPYTRVPNADPSVMGIMSVRGTMVTMIDVRRRLRPAPGGDVQMRIVVVRHGADFLGFEVDRVLRVIDVDRAAIEPHPVVDAKEEDEAIRGVFRLAGALTILLDLDKLLMSSRA
jgi:purine-binding chemotaxis protein CheW